jgi:hypothetical protein
MSAAGRVHGNAPGEVVAAAAEARRIDKGVSAAFSFVRNASEVPPPKVAWKALAIGKLVESVRPVT